MEALFWLFNAQIARAAIWLSWWKLYFASAAAAWLRSRQARHGALAGRRIACASFGTLTGWRRWRLGSARRAPFSPAAGAGEAGASGGAGGAGAALLSSCQVDITVHSPTIRLNSRKTSLRKQKLEAGGPGPCFAVPGVDSEWDPQPVVIQVAGHHSCCTGRSRSSPN